MFETDPTCGSVERATAMRVARRQSQWLLLRTLCRERGESGVDATSRRVAFETSGVWASAADGAVAAGGLGGERQARGTVDAGDGHRGDLSQTRHQPESTGTRNLPVFIEEQSHHRPRSGVVFGHHLHPDEAWVHVSDGGDGLVESVCAGVGIEQHPGDGVLCDGVETGVGTREQTAADRQHRSGSAVHEPGIHRSGGSGGGASEHGRTRAVDGQPVHRTAVEESEV